MSALGCSSDASKRSFCLPRLSVFSQSKLERVRRSIIRLAGLHFRNRQDQRLIGFRGHRFHVSAISLKLVAPSARVRALPAQGNGLHINGIDEDRLAWSSPDKQSPSGFNFLSAARFPDYPAS